MSELPAKKAKTFLPKPSLSFELFFTKDKSILLVMDGEEIDRDIKTIELEYDEAATDVIDAALREINRYIQDRATYAVKKLVRRSSHAL